MNAVCHSGVGVTAGQGLTCTRCCRAPRGLVTTASAAASARSCTGYENDSVMLPAGCGRGYRVSRGQLVSSPPSTACRRHSACKQTAPHSLTAHTLCHTMLRCPCCCPCFCSCYYLFSCCCCCFSCCCCDWQDPASADCAVPQHSCPTHVQHTSLSTNTS